MRELHVVAVSDDGRHVVLATGPGASSGGFRVAVDDLLAAVQQDVAGSDAGAKVPATPKEIQSRLRAGESVEDIAASSGMPLTKVERYAGPVLSERQRVLEQVRNSFVDGGRSGSTPVRLGVAVDQRLAGTKGVRLETVTWSARREQSGVWLVELDYVSQARRRKAVWRYDVARREVTAADSTAARLSLADAEADGGAVAGVAGGAATAPRTARSAPRGPASRSSSRSSRSPAGRSAGASRSPAAPDEPSVAPAVGRASRTVAARRGGRPPAANATSQDLTRGLVEDSPVDTPVRTRSGRSASRSAAPVRQGPAPGTRSTAGPTAASQASSTAAPTSARSVPAAPAESAEGPAERPKPRTSAARPRTSRTSSTAARTATAAPTAAAHEAQALAERKAQALAERKAQALAERKALAAAARRGRAAAARTAAQEVEREAQAAAARRAGATAQRKARVAAQRRAAATAAAQRLEQQHVAVHAQAAGGELPAGPPTLRVVGGGAQPRARERRRAAAARGQTPVARTDASVERSSGDRAASAGGADQRTSDRTARDRTTPERSAPDPSARDTAPATSRTGAAADSRTASRATTARAAGQRPSVPAWADVLLSTGPAAGPAEPQDRPH